MQEKPSAFDNALSNFTFGMANRDLICHMATEGYSVRQIKEATDYPVSVEKIAETVWEYYLETSVIRLTPTGEDDEPRYDYVMDVGKYGKRSFRRIEVNDSNRQTKMETYIPLDIGIIKSRNPEKYQQLLDTLDSRKRDYIEGLPWPDQTVWHIDNLAIREIIGIWSDAGLYLEDK